MAFIFISDVSREGALLGEVVKSRQTTIVSAATTRFDKNRLTMHF